MLSSQNWPKLNDKLIQPRYRPCFSRCWGGWWYSLSPGRDPTKWNSRCLYLSMISLLLILSISFNWFERRKRNSCKEKMFELRWCDVWRRHLAGMKSETKAFRAGTFHAFWLSLLVAKFRCEIQTLTYASSTAHELPDWKDFKPKSAGFLFRKNSPKLVANP